MKYLRKSLGEGETLICTASIAWPYHLSAWLALIFLGVLVIGVIIFIRMQIWLNMTEFGVTDRRVVLKEGWMRRRTQELALTSIEEVEVRQGFWGRIFNFGELVLSGTGEGGVVSPPIARPVDVRARISDARAATA